MAYRLGGSAKKSEISSKTNEKKNKNPQSSAPSKVLVSQDRWRLILLMVAMAAMTILQVGWFHVQYQPEEGTIPDAPLVIPSQPSTVIGSTSSQTGDSTSSIISQRRNEVKPHPAPFVMSLPNGSDSTTLSNEQKVSTPLLSPVQSNEKTAVATTATAVTRSIPNSNETRLATSSNVVTTTPPQLRFDVLARRHGPSPQFPKDFDRTGEVMDILQDTSFDLSTLRPLNLTLQTDMLGILVDAGRHYFPLDWLKRLVDVLSVLQYNLIHLRLTDDQAFAIQLDSQPALACPTHLYGNTKVYTQDDIRALIAYASAKGISIVPEINVPGHAGAWMGIPGLVIPCRKHACRKGYALPLNISHPNIRGILTDVIREVVDIFENPPYLHLGGDEMELAKPCFDEVGAELFDYNDFEGMLQSILQDVGYPEEQVIRWRETSFAAHTAQDTNRLKAKKRAGTINHWWHDTPGKTENVTIGTPIIGSARLYMDVNVNEAAWEVFLHSRKWWHLSDVFAQNAPVNLKGIIVGGFELDANFFHDRNVIGRLLAVTIGVSDSPISNGNELNELYSRLCRDAGFPDALCRKYGYPMLDWGSFKGKWSQMWSSYKRDICDRFPTLPTAKN